MQNVYLDHSATTPVDKAVAAIVREYMVEKFGNPSSIHSYGRSARPIKDQSREQIASVIGCLPEEVYFTSGGTEADNLAMIGYALGNRDKGNHIVISNIEHPAVEKSAKMLEGMEFEVTRVKADQYGEVPTDDVKDALTDSTILVSIMHVNNEVGTINDLSAIGSILSEHDIAFHTDAVQSFGKVPIDVKAMGLDMLSLSAHKFYGPKGIGALYVRNGISLSPRTFGGGQESGYRSGTENIPGIAAIGLAASICQSEITEEASKLTRWRDYMYDRIKGALSDVSLNGHPIKRLPGNLSLLFRGVPGDALLIALDMEGVAASAGSACASGSITPSPVLSAIGLSDSEARSSIRFTLGRSNSREEIEYAANVVINYVRRFRETSVNAH